MSRNSEHVLTIEGVSRFYPDEDHVVEALKDIHLHVRRGSFVSILGASGCGKTTLLRLIAGLDPIQEGSIRLNGREVSGPDPERGYVFQQGSLFQWLSVEGNIASGLKARHVYKEKKNRVPEMIHMIGLDGFEKAWPHQISGGMAQRVAIARALINDPEVLLLDEPMGALDSFTRADLQDKLLEIQREEQKTMLLVTHDVDEAIYLSDEIVIMTPRPGKISEILTVDIPHPRHRGGTEFLTMRRRILERFHLASAAPQPEYNI